MSPPAHGPKVVFLGGALTGNRGAESMLRAAVQLLRAEIPNAQFTLLSLYPAEEAGLEGGLRIDIVPFSPATLLSKVFPVAAALGLGRRLGLHAGPRSRRVWPEALRAIDDADLFIDLSGVSFVDGRGAPVLAYNVLSVLVPWLLQTRTLKYAQALGPFEDPVTRLAARLCLPLTDRVLARGALTEQYLHRLGLADGHVARAADAAFAMEVPDTARAHVRPLLEHAAFAQDAVAVSASSVVEAYCTESGIDYVFTMAAFIRTLLDRGYGVVLIAHSSREASERPKNNDLLVCRSIAAQVGAHHRLLWHDAPLGAEELRALIGACRFLVASRFHAMISGLAEGVPSCLVGWSHKYQEVLAMFGLERFSMDYAELGSGGLLRMFDRLVEEEQAVREAIAIHLPEVRESSRDNARHAIDLLRAR